MRIPARTVGIVGGISPESTIEYYRHLIAEYRAGLPAGDERYPLVVIDSIDLTRLVDLMEAGALDAVTDYLVGEVARLAAAGAGAAALAANTPHIVFEGIRRRAPIPMISLVEATCEAAAALGVKRVGILGTRFTMQGSFYPEVFSRRGIEVVAPEAADQDDLHERYMTELVHGVFRPETRERLLAIAGRLHERRRAEAIVLAGTELPLILPEAPDLAVPLLDTTRIHVRRIAAWMLSGV